jgi:hypothetical protein
MDFVQRNTSCCSTCWQHDRFNSSDGCLLIHYDVFLLSEQSPCSHSEHLQHGHPCSLFIAKLSNFWNMMATSRIQMLVAWYDSGHLWMYCGVLCTLNKVHLHNRNTCNTDTRVRCKFLQFILNMMATSPIQTLVSWYDAGIFRYTVVFWEVYA